MANNCRGDLVSLERLPVDYRAQPSRLHRVGQPHPNARWGSDIGLLTFLCVAGVVVMICNIIRQRSLVSAHTPAHGAASNMTLGTAVKSFGLSAGGQLPSIIGKKRRLPLQTRLLSNPPCTH
ncbi:unnamed protein product [Vitrella brassicaformis CCMP3155]|uniref:Uncharacterized protein n=1 Tax=Vitrella brassicaformis (strain CCMP3155) TaxID=1169540 RepID=A0A0G4H0Y7_VITBC|nr:unnamed protein product [Vitrella brassicaformis CCMP3155]|eukprot:CEM37143.1 unnamed protein product [Vitrella brassicaformis CCMP3155]